MTPRVFPFVPQTSCFTWLIRSAHCFPCRIEVFTCFPAYEKEMECLRKLLAEVETDEDSDFDKEDNGHEYDLEETFRS
ncbi:hypothetical protein AVEN_159694-1 [Araneus ventricosus]|uniref:Uncharacterized protein n=1 Tax=Araneus ventricosus TaxID=182803 RepID=A0A4Y2L818_ARAVE|nr:hypothetical protein AVEN_159694-1 [Araneus ventricosus]